MSPVVPTDGVGDWAAVSADQQAQTKRPRRASPSAGGAAESRGHLVGGAAVGPVSGAVVAADGAGVGAGAGIGFARGFDWVRWTGRERRRPRWLSSSPRQAAYCCYPTLAWTAGVLPRAGAAGQLRFPADGPAVAGRDVLHLGRAGRQPRQAARLLPDWTGRDPTARWPAGRSGGSARPAGTCCQAQAGRPGHSFGQPRSSPGGTAGAG